MKTYSLFISFIVVGLSLSLADTAFPEGHWGKAWLNHLAAVLIIGGGLGIVEKSILRKENFNETRRLFKIHKTIVELGLEEISRDANHYNYTNILRQSPHLSIVLNDGRTWVSAHISDIAERFKRPEFVTEFFVPDPKGNFISIIARKTGYTKEEQILKIEQAQKRLLEEFKTHGSIGRLCIYNIHHFPTHSLFLGSDIALITLYGVSSGRRAVPLFLFRKTTSQDSLFDDVASDVEKLRIESTCVFDSDKSM